MKFLPAVTPGHMVICNFLLAGEGVSDGLETTAASSAASGDTQLLTGSANYVFFDADDAANQKQQKKKGKGKKE